MNKEDRHIFFKVERTQSLDVVICDVFTTGPLDVGYYYAENEVYAHNYDIMTCVSVASKANLMNRYGI
jgi:hypothetical protein